MSDSTGWQRLGSRVPTELVDARLQLHWAAQLVSAVGTTLLPPAPDESHTILEWLAEPGLLAGRLVADAPRCCAALRPSDLTLCLLNEHGATVAAHHLHGWSLSQAMAWLTQEIAAFFERPLAKPLQRRMLDLPDHAVARGGAFSIRDATAFAELGRWYANADGVLRGLVRCTQDASPVRCWPHHFDIATLVSLDRGPSHEATRTIGIGMSPGDGNYAEPYWYVTPFPYPDHPSLPVIDGCWHQTGWLGAVLTGSKLTTSESADAQARRVNAFLRSALDACRELLAATA